MFRSLCRVIALCSWERHLHPQSGHKWIPMNHKRHLKKYKERDRDGLPFPLKGSSNTYGRLILQNRERSGDTGKDSIIFDGAWGGGRGGFKITSP